MQAGLLYDWERNFVEPRARRYLSREDCEGLVRDAAVHSGIRVPDIRFVKSASMPCKAVPSKWRVEIADWGRDPVTVLHEVAHLAALDAARKGEDPHGPAFLAQAISFYARFIGLDEAWLRKTAASVGLAVGERLSSGLPAPRKASAFDGVEF